MSQQIALAVGALLAGAVMSGAFWFTARYAGLREALTALGFSLAFTAVVVAAVAAVLLIAYGTTGDLS